MVQAWSQVDSRLAVASMPNSRRPRLPGVRLAGRRSTARTKASISFAPAVDGTLRSSAIAFDPLRRVEYGAQRASRQCKHDRKRSDLRHAVPAGLPAVRVRLFPVL